MYCAVVATHNRAALLAKCLEALLAQTAPLDSIYVIDNASTDGTGALIRERFPSVHHLRLPENTGGAGAFHRGIRWAYDSGHAWIWIMDDDCIPRPDALEKLLASAAQPSVAAAIPAKVTYGGEPWIGEGVFKSGRLLPAAPSLYAAAFDCDCAPFLGMLVPRASVASVGTPLPELFLWGDDSEYCARLRTIGRILVVPSSVVAHPSLGAPDAAKRYYGLRNTIYLRRRLLPKLSLPGIAFNVFRQCAVILLRRPEKKTQIRVLLTALLHGIFGRTGKAPAWLAKCASS